MPVGTPSRGGPGRYIPPSGTLALAVLIGLVVMLLVLVAAALWVTAHRPPATSFEPKGPATLQQQREPLHASTRDAAAVRLLA